MQTSNYNNNNNNNNNNNTIMDGQSSVSSAQQITASGGGINGSTGSKTEVTPTSTSTGSVALSTRMILSGIAGIGGATICHPLDVIRVQMQTTASSSTTVTTTVPNATTYSTAVRIYRTAGIINGLYAGISAAYLRQITYGSTRMGLYSYMLEQIQNKNNNTNNTATASSSISFQTKFMLGCISGSIGSFIGTPSELALVRMSADMKEIDISKRRNYKNVIDCIIRVINEEGIQNLWRGALPTILRATMMSSCSLGITSEVKSYITRTGILNDKQTQQPLFYGYPTMFVATTISSFFATIACNPFDVIKSRLQNMSVTATNIKPMYNGMIDCFIKSIKGEGIMVLYKGFTPAFIKLAPYSIISLTIADKLTKAITGKDAL
jgi:solute carrier family 25 (mitochondrial oxoglutarate transporter), member 11